VPIEGREMRKPNKVNRVVQPKEFTELSLPRAIPVVYLVDQCKGRAYIGKGFVTVPQWAEERGRDYFLWYIAHELSHILSCSHLHDFTFYKMFLQICPESLQHHELHYKPSAIGFGIKV